MSVSGYPPYGCGTGRDRTSFTKSWYCVVGSPVVNAASPTTASLLTPAFASAARALAYELAAGADRTEGGWPPASAVRSGEGTSPRPVASLTALVTTAA